MTILSPEKWGFHLLISCEISWYAGGWYEAKVVLMSSDAMQLTTITREVKTFLEQWHVVC
jgi:hypothetical protein